MVKNNDESVGLCIKPFDDDVDANLMRPQATRPPAFLYQNTKFNHNNASLKSYPVVALSFMPVLPPSSMP